MGYSYKPDDVEGFFDNNNIASSMPPSFWWRAIPAASELGFGIGKINSNSITVVTPDRKKLIYKGLKGPDTLTYLGIVLTHAILNTKLHD
jgi:hypothetical protein